MASSTSKQLSTLIISPSDLKKARREIEAVDEFLHQSGLRATAVRDGDGKQVKLPQLSRLVETLATETGTNLLKAADRKALIGFVQQLAKSAPVLHISFASEPSGTFLSKLVLWLRTNIHPQVLVHVGLQPSIAAGCVVRTANRQFDFSLAQSFEKQRGLLVESLSAQTGALPDETRKIEEEVLAAAKSKAEKELAA